VEAAWPVAYRSRERAAYVSEELTFEHLARDGTAVDSHKRPLRPSAPFVDLSREQFFARAGLSGDQNCRPTRCHVVDLLQDVTKRAATAHNPAEV
jgi:hypothetical protein